MVGEEASEGVYCPQDGEVGQHLPPLRRVASYEDNPEGRKLWLEARRSGIGASESPAIMGVPNRPKWSNSILVWESKTLPAAFSDNDPSEEQEAGQELEDAIIQWASKRLDCYGHIPGAIRHFKWGPVMQATPDALVCSTEREGYGLIQAKNVSEFEAGRRGWDDGCPLHVQAQVQHELLVSGRTWGFVAAALGGRRLRCYEIVPDPAYQEALVRGCEKWWNDYVLTEKPPPYNWSAEARRAAARAFKADDTAEPTTLPEGAEGRLDAWDSHERLMKKHEEQVNRMKGWFVRQMQLAGADEGVCPTSGRIVTWKANSRNIRTLRRKANNDSE